jgi:ectoine hydroxylase-related dioxygenase (phytanoyl-CoA dioxygenase family)
MALDDTHPDGGTIEYVTGSHNWPVSSELYAFHAPEDYHEGLRSAAESLGIAEYEVVKLKVNAGDAVFHHGGTWHGSGSNRTENPRRSVVAHCMNSESRHHPENLSPIYSRYKKQNCLELDENFFPVLWHKNGHRTAFLDS